MGYAALMVHADPSDAGEARVRLAADLADRFGAALIGFASGSVMPPPVVTPVFGPALVVDVLEAEQQRVEAELRAAHERFRALAEREGRHTGWRSFLEHPAHALAREARAADLLVLGRDREALREAPYRALDVGDALMRGARGPARPRRAPRRAPAGGGGRAASRLRRRRVRLDGPRVGGPRRRRAGPGSL